MATLLRDALVLRLCVTSFAVVPLSSQQLPVRQVALGVYVVLGDTGRGSEGRPNAGFIVTGDGVVVIDALASPAQGELLVRTILMVVMGVGVVAFGLRATVHFVRARNVLLTHWASSHRFGGVARYNFDPVFRLRLITYAFINRKQDPSARAFARSIEEAMVAAVLVVGIVVAVRLT